MPIATTITHRTPPILQASTLVVAAASVNIASGAALSTTGLGLYEGPGVGTNGNGGSHAGAGGRVHCLGEGAAAASDVDGGTRAHHPCCDGSFYVDQAGVIGNMLNPLAAVRCTRSAASQPARHVCVLTCACPYNSGMKPGALVAATMVAVVVAAST